MVNNTYSSINETESTKSFHRIYICLFDAQSRKISALLVVKVSLFLKIIISLKKTLTYCTKFNIVLINLFYFQIALILIAFNAVLTVVKSVHN